MKRGTDAINGLMAQRFAGFTGSNDRSYALIILLLIILGLSMKFCLWFQGAINQDEFHYLSYVHAYEREELIQPMQNFHVHFFSWLDAFSNNEVTQVMIARSVMFLFLGGTCSCILLLGTHFIGFPGALFSVLCYVSFQFTMVNGASFRPDTPATFLFMFALYLFVVKKTSVILNVTAGIALALACLFTIKAAIYFGVFVGLFIIEMLISNDRQAKIRQAFYFLTSLTLGFVLFYKLHAAKFLPSTSEHPRVFLGRAFSKFVGLYLHPMLDVFRTTLILDCFTWLLLLSGFFICLARLLRDGIHRSGTEARLLTLSVPIFSLIFFRNTGPYFYVFILPSAILLCGYTFSVIRARIERKIQRPSPTCIAALCLCVVLLSFLYYLWNFERATQTKSAQYDLISVIHRMFPEPVPYIDGCCMVSSFSNTGFFMSSAGMRLYLEAGNTAFKNVLVDKKPVFLLANVPHLDLNSDEPPKSFAGLALLQEDWTALRSYFIHHWGPIWVVGKEFNLKSETFHQNFEITRPGLYTVETNTEILIDGNLYHTGDVVHFEQAPHTIEVTGTNATIKLRWDDHLYRPKSEPSWTSLFLGALG